MVQVKEEELDREHKMLNGRQIAWMIYDFFRTTKTEGKVMDFSDLLGVQLHGDNLMRFQQDWKSAVSYTHLTLPTKRIV